VKKSQSVGGRGSELALTVDLDILTW